MSVLREFWINKKENKILLERPSFEILENDLVHVREVKKMNMNECFQIAKDKYKNSDNVLELLGFAKGYKSALDGEL